MFYVDVTITIYHAYYKYIKREIKIMRQKIALNRNGDESCPLPSGWSWTLTRARQLPLEAAELGYELLWYAAVSRFLRVCFVHKNQVMGTAGAR